MNAIIEVHDIAKRYGDFQALRSVSFTVPRGDTLAVIGPNGAGKTTLFRVITGETAATSGTVKLAGRDISQVSADERARMGMGRTFQIVRVFNDFTAAGNVVAAIEARDRHRHGRLGLFAFRPSRAVAQEAHYMLEQVNLAADQATLARHLSLGDRKRLEFAVNLVLEPSILMLDEPTAGMSPRERVAIVELVERVRESMGLTIVVTEHDMDFVFRLARTVMVMNHGERVFLGTPDEARRSELVRTVYMGKESVHA